MGTFHPGRNAWRVAHADRAALLIDGAPFFAAVRSALMQAQRSVFVIGWDLDSRTALAGAEDPHDGWPETLRAFLTRLVEERPALTIHLLAWDYAVLYALEREPFPSLKLGWNTPPRVRFRLDNALPVGASHHQKIIVIDDALAFSGGLDLTIRRWDTSRHDFDDPHRVDPAGKPYRPFHDVQMVVDGAAAQALGELARERWARATGEASTIAPHGTPWPDVVPDFTDVQAAIARTLPADRGQPEVREVETLFHDMIGMAERAIYIENQYLTCCAMAQALCRRLRERPQLEVLIVAPHTPDTWLESHTMRNGRIRFRRTIEQEGMGARVRLVYPQVRLNGNATHTMVHSKVMIVDDRLLRVGSANLNNRSMGTDTECDLTIEARHDADRAAIRDARARLLADHCGVPVAEAAHAIDATSLIAAAESLSGRGHSLQPIEDGEPDQGEFAEYVEGIADPERPLEGARVLAPLLGEVEPRHNSFIWLKLAGVVLAFVALAIAWQFPPLSTLADPETIGTMLRALAAEPWAPLLVLGVYVIGGLIAFPVLLLIAATAAAFGPLAGLFYAAAGSLLSATVTYAIGTAIGRDALRAVIGPRLKRVQRRIVRGGVLTIAAIRLVPIAPFTVVNLVAGASEIRFSAFIGGTVLGMAPGLIVMSALGHQIMRIITGPSGLDVALLAVVVAVWLALAGGVQIAFAKFGRRS
jgi:phosphatidylserine/phosphatidylglycerophosphate/cardiolipin synthase-like enzyme/uncharacterized membrane protein YdjX (TVP38/TMEM64 family)